MTDKPTTTSRGATVQVKCACGCGVIFTARVADRKRGWGKYASKSCKARRQEARTGQYQAYKAREYQREFGGTPQFDRNGNYEGFTCINGSDGHDCNKD